jgi:probable HAF family extracellular repeat protein
MHTQKHNLTEIRPSQAKRRISWRFSILTLLILGDFGSLPRAAMAQSYVYQTIDVPSALPSSTQAWGINDAGHIVGFYEDSNFLAHGFIFAGGQFTTFDAPGAFQTYLVGINNAGDIVGYYATSAPCAGNHGFLLSGGIFTQIDFPGGFLGCDPTTIALGISNTGQVVGSYVDSTGSHGFISSGGAFTTLDVPSSQSTAGACCQTIPRGINSGGAVVGYYIDNNGDHGFLFANGQYTTIDLFGFGGPGTIAYGINDAGAIVAAPSAITSAWSTLFTTSQAVTISFPGALFTAAHGINNAGGIVGYSELNPTTAHAFLATVPGISIVDPVPDLLNGPTITTSLSLLATKGRPVLGVAADGVTQVLLRMSGASAGDQLSLTLQNDQQPPTQSSSPSEDGAIGNLGATTFTQSQVTVAAQDTGNGVFAFAVYRAPLDFARPNGSGFKTGICGPMLTTDDQLACRTVTIQIQNLTSGAMDTQTITILRPPVILVHGLWASWVDWNTFSPLVTGAASVDSRFSVGRVNYNATVNILASDPVYKLDKLGQAQANSLGLQYNAPNVRDQISQWILQFTQGSNPANVPVAAIQADIVGHSMGGLVTRTLPLLPNFLSNSNFGQGYIHKVITVDTPHLGSPVAIQMLSPAENGGCLQNLLAGKADFAFNSVTLDDGEFFSGAMADMHGDGSDGSLSSALNDIKNLVVHPLPIALIVGVYTNWTALDNKFSSNGTALLNNAFLIRNICHNDPLAQSFTSTGWPPIFNGRPNDGVVSETSQLNNLIPSPGSQYFGFAHSPGVTMLGFAPPTVMDAGTVPTQVIFLLNTPATNSVYYNLLNP